MLKCGRCKIKMSTETVAKLEKMKGKIRRCRHDNLICPRCKTCTNPNCPGYATKRNIEALARKS